MSSFHKVVHFIILAVCLSVVVLECIFCFIKFFNEPQGTTLTVENAPVKNMFPVITVCPQPKTPLVYNDTILIKCGIENTDIYRGSGGPGRKVDPQWIGNGSEDCTNPKLLYERLVTTKNQLILFNGSYYVLDIDLGWFLIDFRSTCTNL